MLSRKSHNEIAKMKPLDTDRKFLLVNHRIAIIPLIRIPKVQTKRSQYLLFQKIFKNLIKF